MERLMKKQQKNEKKLEQNFKHIVPSTEGKFFYHMSIIDYLQEYNTKKKCEHFWRVSICRANKKKISCIPSI